MEINKIFLPFFRGFYNTIHDIDTDIIYENFLEDLRNWEGLYPEISEEEKIKALEWTDKYYYIEFFDKYFDVDYNEYRKDYSIEYYEVFKKEFSKVLEEEGIFLGDYVGINSPREYNFATDSIEVEVKYDFNLLKSKLFYNREEFSKFIKEQNTSYDGFIAYWENDFDNYINKAENNFWNFEPFEITQIIEFFVKKYWDTVDEVDVDNFIAMEVLSEVYSSSYIIKK